MKVQDFIRLEKKELIEYITNRFRNGEKLDIEMINPPNRKRKIVKIKELDCCGLYGIDWEGWKSYIEVSFYGQDGIKIGKLSIRGCSGYLYNSIYNKSGYNTIKELLED